MDVLQLHQAERAVQQFPGQTLPELAAVTGADREILRDALVELSRQGKAHTPVGALTRCRVTGEMRATWQSGPDPDAGMPGELIGAYASAMKALSVPVDPRQQPLFPIT